MAGAAGDTGGGLRVHRPAHAAPAPGLRRGNQRRTYPRRPSPGLVPPPETVVPVSPAPVPVSPAPASSRPVPPTPEFDDIARSAVESEPILDADRAPSPTRAPDGAGHAGRHRARWAWEARYLRSVLLADIAAASAAAACAFGLRFGAQITAYNAGYALLSAVFPLAFLVAVAANRAYDKRYLFVGTDEYQRIMRAGLALTATVAMVAYACEIRLARGYVIIVLPLVTALCLVARFALRKYLHRMRKRRGACMRRVVVVGHELAVVAITRQLRRERYHGLRVVGACLPVGFRPGAGPAEGWHDGQVGDVQVLGTFDDVHDAVRKVGADTVLVLSCPELDGHALRRLAWRLETDDIDLIVASSLIDVAGARTTIRPFDGLPMLHVEHPTLGGVRRVVKAAFDRIGAFALLTMFLPVLVGLAVAVRVDSPGPVLFRQVRVGKDGREFVIFKFRTMHTDAEAKLAELRHLNESDGVLFKMRDDPRVTRVGRWLRKLSLDELPQLLNVLGGTMSLVGPRPPLRAEVDAYPEDVRRRLVVRPGMTGLWQVSGRSDLPWEEAVRLDLRYVENWTLSLDLVILLRTLSAVTRGAGAY